MARNQGEKGGGIWLKTLLFGALVMVGVAAAAIILQPMLVAPSSDVALIKAEPGPFREKPKDPGGTRIPHTESTVMGMLGGVVDRDENVEILQPPADVPEMPPLPKASDDEIVMAPAPAAPPELAETGTGGAVVATEAVAGDEPQLETQTTDAPAEDTGTEIAESMSEATATPTSTDDDSATDAGGDTMASPQTIPQSKPEVPKRANGPEVEGDVPLYLVQLAAFRNANTAREQAAMLDGKHQSRLGGVELGTMKVDAGENGIFWRVVTEPLERADADNLCSALKRAGQDCILRKFDSQP